MSKFIEDYQAPKVFARIGQKAIVLNNQNKLLLLRRSKKCDRAGGWDFPGGGLDSGEDPIKAITREIKEETGLEVFNVKPIHVVSHFAKNKDFIVMIGYQAKAKSNKAKLSWEHDQYKWVSKQEVLKIDLPDVHRSFVEKLKIGSEGR